jgi:hypothetical protein
VDFLGSMLDESDCFHRDMSVADISHLAGKGQPK